MTNKNSGRDEFSLSTKDLIAKKSGYICAYPSCKRMTISSSTDRKSKLTMTGVAAHITAAAKGGPRYDVDMMPEVRSSESNGIWLCQTHGKFVDDNPSKISVKELYRWKSQHEKWVFDRVESGAELFNDGINKLRLRGVGIFSDELQFALGKHNILVGKNESGKSTLCQIINSFSHGSAWEVFDKRFNFSKSAEKNAFIEISQSISSTKNTIRLSPQFKEKKGKITNNTRQRLHVEVNGLIAADWPRTNFKVLYFDSQLYRTHHSDPKDTFLKTIKYLANVFDTTERLIWDSFDCEELFYNSTFGYKFKRSAQRKLEVLVPDGRGFYISHQNLSFTEQQMAFLDIALKLISFSSKSTHWLIIFDSSFYQRLNPNYKKDLFMKLTKINNPSIQTLFCLNSSDDVEALKEINFERWVNASQIKELTMHSFL